MLAAGEAPADLEERGADRAQRRDDARPALGEAAVEEREPGDADETGGRAEPEVGGGGTPADERRDDEEEDEADGLGAEHHRGLGGPPGGHPAGEVAGAPRHRGQEPEQDGHRVTVP